MFELLGLFGALMMLGCFVPQDKLPRGLPHDSVLHIGAFALLTLALCMTSPDTAAMWRYAFCMWILGLLVECIQHFVPTRQFGVDDLVYNALGIFLVLIPCSLV